ncbi:hypothetical protein N665_0963s0004 [Sinapis alba]|nr:hypothetical protein N665_0963s0004 [Sinapis alba]
MSTFSYLLELEPNKSNWKIKTKIIRMWKQYSPVVGETIELVLCDSFLNTIHASVSKYLVKRFEPVLKEEYSKIIINFAVTPSVGAYRITKHAHKIAFKSTTRVRVSELLPCQLTGFQPIVVGFSNLEIISVNGKDTHKLSLQLKNQVDQRVTVVLWGKYADCVSNVYNISDISINPYMDEVEAFLKLLQNDDLTLEFTNSKPLCLVLDISEKNYFFVDTPKKTITEVLGPTKVQMCIIMCTIAAIDTDKGWYYLSCKVYGNEILTVSNDWSAGGADDLNIFPNYYCVKCKTYSPKRDTRLFFLFDKLAQQLIGLPCTALTSGNTAEIEGRALPAVLTELVGKTYVFKINIDKGNYLCKHETFKVLKIITITDNYEVAVNHSPMCIGSTNYRLIPRKRGSPFLDVAQSLEMNCVTKGSCSVRIKKERTDKSG